MSEATEKLLEVMRTATPLPKHVLHVERMAILDSLPKREPEQVAPWAGFPVQVDPVLPPGVYELRDEAGNVLATNARPTREEYLEAWGSIDPNANWLRLAQRIWMTDKARESRP